MTFSADDLDESNARQIEKAGRAPRRADGTFAYVRTHRSWGRTTDSLVYSQNLAEAKASYGWTREKYTTISVRRATVQDVETLQDYR